MNAGISNKLQTRIAEAEKLYTGQILQADEEDELFILFYAFYKGLASTHRYKIPTFDAMYQAYKHEKNNASFVIASEDGIPIGMLWLTQRNDSLIIQALGSIMRGMEKGVDLFLLRQAFQLGQKEQVSEYIFEPNGRFPLPESQKHKDTFHAMIGL